ncbi:GNAT family N-acetyltransferase [Bacillus sp. Bva_UNVM-123]|uniref:GNAT family N-acetyltransferase n=1 Tax=Bacillus sp. Bva_UNVM-123 TaxID=2829798 RepID=UPI00391F3227
MTIKRIDLNNLSYKTNYSSDVTEREKLYHLFESVFGIHSGTLRDFSNKGLWNDNYIPYTYFNGDKAVANVSAFPLAMIINGELKNCMGIQSVMTDPDYRKNGLMKVLVQKMLNDIDHTSEGAFLFTSSPQLYTPFGFKEVKQYYFKKEFNQQSIKQKYSLRKLEPLTDSIHLKMLADVFKKRQHLSTVFAPLSYLECLYFNLYDPWIYERLYFIEELKLIIVFEVQDGILRMYDVIGESIPSLEEVCSCIPYNFHSIEFYFNPDSFALDDIMAIEFKTENTLMARGLFQLEKGFFMMPLTSEF